MLMDALDCETAENDGAGSKHTRAQKDTGAVFGFLSFAFA